MDPQPIPTTHGALTETVNETETATSTDERGVLHHRGGRLSVTRETRATKGTSFPAISTSIVHGATRETARPLQAQHTPILRLAQARHIAAVESGVDEVAGTLQAEDDLSTATSATDTMTHVIARGDHGAGLRPRYGATEMFGRSGGTIGILTDATVTTDASSLESTTLTSDPLARRNLACAP